MVGIFLSPHSCLFSPFLSFLLVAIRRDFCITVRSRIKSYLSLIKRINMSDQTPISVADLRFPVTREEVKAALWPSNMEGSAFPDLALPRVCERCLDKRRLCEFSKYPPRPCLVGPSLTTRRLLACGGIRVLRPGLPTWSPHQMFRVSQGQEPLRRCGRRSVCR